ncbi:ATP-dependent DNA helicase Q-like 2-like, partial [Planoprotostelium fungivorum]
SGRAGRDGLGADCILYYRSADQPRLSAMVGGDANGHNNLKEMVRYCEDLRTCRRVSLSQHFGQEFDAMDCNQQCDHCQHPEKCKVEDITQETHSLLKFLNIQKDNKEKMTLNQLADAWRGNGKSPAPSSCVTKRKKGEVERIILQLLLEGIVTEKIAHTAYQSNSYIIVGPEARTFQSSNRKITIDMLQEEGKRKSGGEEMGGKKKGLPKHIQNVVDQLTGLRTQLAAANTTSDGGKFLPHQILSEQGEHLSWIDLTVHVDLISIAEHNITSMEHLSTTIGQTKAGRFGEDILNVMRNIQEFYNAPASTVTKTSTSTTKTPVTKTKAKVGKGNRINFHEEIDNDFE